jgi:hypothetical protein
LFANLDLRTKVNNLVLTNSRFRYVVAAYLVALIPSLILAVGLYFSGLSAQNKIMTARAPVWIDFIGVTLFAPIVETLLMFPIFGILRIFTKRIGWLSFWSAITWALLHSALHPIWGLTTFWTFFVLSFSFLLWEQRGKRWAFVIPATIHILNNTVIFAVVLLSRSSA